MGLVYSQQTAWFVGNKTEDHTLGWYQALIEARIPFEMMHDRLLDTAHLGQVKTLILPNVAALSDTQCQQLRDFVTSGGSVIATHETSLCNEWGVRRKNFGLAELFGVNFTGRIESRMQNAYLRLEHEVARGHALLRGLEDAPRIIHGVSRVEVEPNDKFPPAPLTLVPSYPDLPMEKVYPRVVKTNVAQVFLREFGKGRVVYFPWDIDRTFWEVLSPDQGKLLRNSVEWAANEEPLVTVTGPGVLDVTLWRQKASLALHLVNLTNPMMMKGPIRELVPVGPHQVRIRLPTGMNHRRLRLLASETTPKVGRSGQYLTLAIRSILDHEIVAIDL